MKIMIYSEKWDTGGIEAFLMNVLSRMDRSSIGEIDLVVSQNITDKYDEKLDQLGIRKTVTLERTYSSPILRVLSNILCMKELLKKRKYDVIHFNVCNSVTFVYAYLAKRYGAGRVIVHSHNNDIGGDNHFIKLQGHRLCRFLFSIYVDKRLACSELAANWMFGNNNTNNVQIINNGIELDKLEFSDKQRQAVRKQLGFENNLVIGNVGRLSYQKNQEFLLDVFAELLKINASTRLLLVGDGEDKVKLKNKAKDLGLDDKVCFWGFTNEVGSLLSAMDVFVLTSHFEGFGIVNIEAQANGLPCIVSDNVPESVKLSDNFIFMPLNEGKKAWAESISKMAERGLNHRNNIENIYRIKAAGYDICKTAKILRDIYLEV